MRQPITPPPGGELGGNQRGIGNVTISLFNSNGSIPLLFGELTLAGSTDAGAPTFFMAYRNLR